MKTSLLPGLLAIGVNATANAGGISLGTPLVSGDSYTIVSGQGIGRTSLSSGQLRALASWLGHHLSGWGAQANGGHYLRLTGPGQWGYQSFGGIFKSWAATRPLSDQEWAELESLVSAT